MNHYSRQDIIRMVDEQDIRFIRLQFTDIFGTMKNVSITPSQLEKALNGECMFDGSAIEGFTRVEESDMYLLPNPDTFMIFPWRPQSDKVARLICDIVSPDGKNFSGDPRHILREVIKKADSMDYTFNVGPECEFFLFHQDEQGNPSTVSFDAGSYFDLEPLGQGEDVRREIVLALEDMGFEIEASHHEVAPGQHEIDFRFDEALAAADKLMTFKLAVKTIAHRYGMHATFMPKPIQGVSGSGMHTNMSLFRNGENVFNNPEAADGLSQTARYFIGGLLAHIKGITAIANPLVNSYKRLIPGFEAPCNIAWSLHNRSPLIRIPANRGEYTRLELRSPDPSSNPYLVMALCLAAGLDGITRQIDPGESCNSNIYALPAEERQALGIDDLPASLAEALDEMEKDPLIHAVLGEHVMEKYVAAKRAEWEEYSAYVSKWELDRYLRMF
jgi:glutamine synthetase